MNNQITNCTRHLMILPLNSGESIHLAPGETSPPIADLEVQSNAKLEKLRKANLIAFKTAPGTVRSPRSPETSKAGRAHKKTA